MFRAEAAGTTNRVGTSPLWESARGPIEIMAKILHDKTTLFFNHDYLGLKTIRKNISDTH